MSPATAQETFTYSATISVAGHRGTEAPPEGQGDPEALSGAYSYTNGYPNPYSDGQWLARFFAGDGAAPTSSLSIQPGLASVGFRAGEPPQEYIGDANQCQVQTDRNDPGGVSGTVSCVGMTPLYPRIDNPTIDLTGTFSVIASDAPSPPTGGCTVEGTVTDRLGVPVAGAHVRLEDASGNVLEDVATGTDGVYRFATTLTTIGRVSVLAEEWAHAPSRFKILAPSLVPGIRADVDPAEAASCRRDFPVGALPGAAQAFSEVGASAEEIFELYQELQHAWAATSAFNFSVSDVGHAAAPGVRVVQPRQRALRHPVPDGFGCALLPPRDTYLPHDRRAAVHRDQAGHQRHPRGGVTPALTLYHEFGHFFHWAAFGNLDRHPLNKNHAGYYKNPSSADAWAEGFATFYREMVRKHVVHEPPNHFELWAHEPWDLGGVGEEYALVAALVDLEDGPADYTGTGPVVSPNSVTTVSGGVFVAEFGPDAPVGSPWLAQGVEGVGGTTSGTVIERSGGRVAIGVVPRATRVSVRAQPGGQSGDDDPVDGDLPTLWRALFDHTSDAPWSSGHTFDIVDVHQAARSLYRGDRDGNGVDDVDQIFISHGLFGDVDRGVSNRSYDPEEIPGLTSHYGGELGVDFIPRNAQPAIPELHATIETGGVAAAALVQVSFDAPNEGASFSTVVDPDEDGRFDLGLPPPREGGRLSVIMLADGYLPASAIELSGHDFWERADANPGASFLTADVEFAQGELGSTGGLGSVGAGSTDGGFPWGIVAILGVLAVAAMGLIWVMRFRRLQPAGPGIVLPPPAAPTPTVPPRPAAPPVPPPPGVATPPPPAPVPQPPPPATPQPTTAPPRPAPEAR